MPRRKAQNGNRVLQIIEMEQALDVLKAQFHADCERGDISPDEERYLGLFATDYHPTHSRKRAQRRSTQQSPNDEQAPPDGEPIAATESPQ